MQVAFAALGLAWLANRLRAHYKKSQVLQRERAVRVEEQVATAKAHISTFQAPFYVVPGDIYASLRTRGAAPRRASRADSEPHRQVRHPRGRK